MDERAARRQPLLHHVPRAEALLDAAEQRQHVAEQPIVAGRAWHARQHQLSAPEAEGAVRHRHHQPGEQRHPDHQSRAPRQRAGLPGSHGADQLLAEHRELLHLLHRPRCSLHLTEERPPCAHHDCALAARATPSSGQHDMRPWDDARLREGGGALAGRLLTSALTGGSPNEPEAAAQRGDAGLVTTGVGGAQAVSQARGLPRAPSCWLERAQGA